MKLVAGIAVATVAALFAASHTIPLPTGTDDSVRIISTPATRPTEPIARHAATVESVPPDTPATTPETTDIMRSDQDALDALLSAQPRDPVWAPDTEAAIRSRVPFGSRITCAAFMCRIDMPATANPATTSPDRQADATGLPDGMSYNRQTATIGGHASRPVLTFYVTRTDLEEARGEAG